MRGDGTRAHAPTSGRGRGRARTRSPSSAARPRSATLCAPAQTFPRGSERRCEAFAARAHTLRARSRPVPSELPPACGWGRCGRGFLSLAHPDFPHYCGYWSSKKRGVAGGAAGCVGGNSHVGLALPPCSLSHDGHRAPAGQPHSQKFTPLRSAFALRMDPESHHVKPGVFQPPGPFSFLLPLFFPSQFLGNLLC